MAFFSSDFTTSGLNIISTLDLSLDPQPSKTFHLAVAIASPPLCRSSHSLSCGNMSDSSKSKSSFGGGGGFGSRIPKINFSFRKQNKNVANVASSNGSDNGSCSERSTPEGCEGTPPPVRAAITKQGPGSAHSSPGVGRSKSLRLPRSTYLKFSASHSNVNSVRDEEEDFYPDDIADSGGSGDGTSEEKQSCLYAGKAGKTGLVKSGRPRSSAISGSSQSRSRSISPGGLMMTTNGAMNAETGRFGFYGGSLSQSDFNEDGQVLNVSGWVWTYCVHCVEYFIASVEREEEFGGGGGGGLENERERERE